MFSAIVWPLLFSRFNSLPSGGTVEVVVLTLLAVALPAHAFVVGFGRPPTAAGRSLDTALLKRIVVWLAAAGITTAVAVAIRRYMT